MNIICKNAQFAIKMIIVLGLTNSETRKVVVNA